jgi:hypothetical protein
MKNNASEFRARFCVSVAVTETALPGIVYLAGRLMTLLVVAVFVVGCTVFLFVTCFGAASLFAA